MWRDFQQPANLYIRALPSLRGLRHRQIIFGEIILVVVDADIAIIHGQGVVGWIEFEVVRNILQRRRLIGFENIGIEGAGEEGVVHAKEHISKRRIFGEDGFIEHSACVTALEEDNFCIVGLFKSSDNIFTDGKRVVGQDGEGLRLGWLRRAGGKKKE